MVKIKSFNEKIINYLANERNNEDFVDEGLIFKGKRINKREETNIVNPTSDIKQISNPSSRHSSQLMYRGKHKNGYQYKRSSLQYSFTPDSIAEEPEKLEVSSTTAMTAVVKRNKSSKGFFSSLTKKLLPNKRSSLSRKCSTRVHGSSNGIYKQKSIKYLNNNINKNLNNIPMQVVETLYTISFTKHSYYIQRSLRRSTMIVNLITRFRNTYEELREIDTPKLKRRISFKKRTPNTRSLKKGEQPKQGSLIDLREQRKAKYYEIFGDTAPYMNQPTVAPTMPTMAPVMNSTIDTNSVPSSHHTTPRRRKKLPRKPLLDFSDCDSLPTIPASAAGSKVNQYLANHKETERKKLKPIKSIDKELCLIFNKEYIPEEKMGKANEVKKTCSKITRGTSLEDLRHQNVSKEDDHRSPTFSKHSSINFNNLPISSLPQFAPVPLPVMDSSDEDEISTSVNPEEVSIFEDEKEDEATTIPSPTSATTKVYIPDDEFVEPQSQETKERKRISEGTLYNEAIEEKQPGNVSTESNSSDKTLKEDEDVNLSSDLNDSSFIVVDESVHNIDFHIDESESEDEEEENDDEKPSFLLELDAGYNFDSKVDHKNIKDNSFSLSKSFLLTENSNEESIIPEHMSNFLFNNSKISISEEDELFNNSMVILNNSIINESFSLTLDNYGEENKNESVIIKDTIKTMTDTSKKEEKPLNRIDSGVDLNCMDNITYLMERKCQI